MITTQERINLIKEKLNEAPRIEFKKPIDVGVQRDCLEFRTITNIYKDGKSILCQEGISICNKTGEGVLNIREIQPRDILYILWHILSDDERTEIIKSHFYDTNEWGFLIRATK